MLVKSAQDNNRIRSEDDLTRSDLLFESLRVRKNSSTSIDFYSASMSRITAKLHRNVFPYSRFSKSAQFMTLSNQGLQVNGVVLLFCSMVCSFNRRKEPSKNNSLSSNAVGDDFMPDWRASNTEKTNAALTADGVLRTCVLVEHRGEGRLHLFEESTSNQNRFSCIIINISMLTEVVLTCHFSDSILLLIQNTHIYNTDFSRPVCTQFNRPHRRG